MVPHSISLLCRLRPFLAVTVSQTFPVFDDLDSFKRTGQVFIAVIYIYMNVK